jgi:hypothetical protein
MVAANRIGHQLGAAGGEQDSPDQESEAGQQVVEHDHGLAGGVANLWRNKRLQLENAPRS